MRDDQKPVDTWVRDDLARQFGDVLSELIPRDMLALLEPMRAA